MSQQAPASPTISSRRRRSTHRLGLAATTLLIIVTLVLLPFVLRSLRSEIFATQQRVVYDLITGKSIPANPAKLEGPERTYVNASITGLNLADRTMTIAVSGNRYCSATCPTVDLTLYALDDDADQRRGTPPMATIRLDPEQVIFSNSVTLPVRGQRNLYPFDWYIINLGATVTRLGSDGKPEALSIEAVGRSAIATLQNQDNDLMMATPKPADPAQFRSPTDPYDFLSVLTLTFTRPAYTKVMATLLVLLISVSGLITVTTRNYQDTIYGLGTLVLGIWGIRQVLIPQPLPVTSAIDVALSCVILLLLLTFVFRSAAHFYEGSEIPLRRTRDRSQPSSEADE